MAKIAIVTSEGGMRCAYSVGAILALVEKYHLAKPDFVIGASGSTGTLAYFVSGQYASIKNIWENLICAKRFVSFLRLNKIMDIDYVVDEIFRKQDPLDVETIKNSPIGLYIILTDLKSGEPVYFPQNKLDIFEILRASNAIPVFFGKTVEINGQTFVDGAISFHLEDGIKLAKDLGSTKIIAIQNKNDSLWGKLSYYLYSLFQSKNIRQAMRKKRPNFDNDPSVFIIKSFRKLPIGTLNNNQKCIKETIKMGYDDTATNKYLDKFLEN